MKKLLGLALAGTAAAASLTGCGGNKVEKFEAKDSFGNTTSIYVFEGETTNGKITDLNFDVLDPRITEGNNSKKHIDNYLMNVSDFIITENADDATNFDIKLFSGGCANGCTVGSDQFMDYGVGTNVTPSTKLSDLNWNAYFANPAGTAEFNEESFGQAGAEYNFAPTGDTTVIEWANAIGAITGNDLKIVDERFSFEGMDGGRSFGEQLTAIENYILEQQFTLAETKKFFEDGRFDSSDELVVSGASISYVSSWARIVDVAMGNGVEEGIIDSGSNTDGSEWYNVRTSGYGGDIVLKITLNVAGDQMLSIEVLEENETPSYGGVTLEQANLDILMGLANTGDIDTSTVVAGATQSHNAVVDAIKFVLDEM